jgi:hypothetical protein
MRSEESLIRISERHRVTIRDLLDLAAEIGGAHGVEVLRLASLIGDEVAAAIKESGEPSDREN